MESIGARINPHWKEAEPYFVEQDDARREADVDQQVEVGQHELPADHLRLAPRLAARGWRPTASGLAAGGSVEVDAEASAGRKEGITDRRWGWKWNESGRGCRAKGRGLVRWVSRSAGPLDGDPMDMAGLIALSQGSVCCVPGCR